MSDWSGIKAGLQRIYGDSQGDEAFETLLPVLEKYPERKRQKPDRFSQEDVVLITYGDSLRKDGQTPLATLREFADEFLSEVVSAIHILPFSPYSSDDGFSVMDYRRVNPQLGSWDDIRQLGGRFRLMFDLVLNHVSAQSPWFDRYLQSESGFESLAIEVDPEADLSKVTRPRALPLLSEFKKSNGQVVHLWTTFSADQIDLNYASPEVLARMVDVLLFYVEQGAALIRLDAIAYLWKQLGTSCIHLPQTHEVVRLFRTILDRIAPDVAIVTETNVPHDENLSYFGGGRGEAQMVYNFTLPPLLLYTFVQEDAGALARWAATLQLESPENAFFNFTSSHDGIGVRPLEGILPRNEIDRLVERVKANGGQVSTKRNPDGSESPYELNITYLDALADPRRGEEDPWLARRFLASQAIQMALPGVPGIYMHSLLGSRNWTEGVRQTGRARTINREKLQDEQVRAELATPGSFRSKVFSRYCTLLAVRRRQPAFHPNAAFEVLDAGPAVFAILRTSAEQRLCAVTNVTSRPVAVSLRDCRGAGPSVDLLGQGALKVERLELEPYQTAWITDAGSSWEQGSEAGSPK